MAPQYGELRPTNGWDRFGSFGHPSKFQRVSRLAFVTAVTSLTGGQQNFARYLAVSWTCTIYIHFRGLLPPWWNFARCKIHFTYKSCVFLYWQRYCTALHSSSGPHPHWRGRRNGITQLLQRAQPIFGWAAITLGIGPHSSSICLLNKSSAVAEISDRLATIDMGRKVARGCCGSTGSLLGHHNTMWPGPRPTSLLSGILIHPTVWPQL